MSNGSMSPTNRGSPNTHRLGDGRDSHSTKTKFCYLVIFNTLLSVTTDRVEQDRRTRHDKTTVRERTLINLSNCPMFGAICASSAAQLD